ADPRPEPIKTRPALQKLADLAARPSAPERMRREVEGMVKAWLDGASADRRIELKEKLGEMEEQLQAGIESAGDMMDEVDADNAAARRHGDNALAALKAARQALLAAGLAL
uniref:hypothetical protein n=1 Tax=Roseomonas sp. 18066 TaxID=2681412 RepID=UPI0038D135E8